MTVERSPQSRPGNMSALKHGANSPTQIRARARAHKRRFLRRAGLRAGDLDAVANELLSHWARGAAQLDLREGGGVDSGKDYWVAYNGTRRTLEKLEQRLGVAIASTRRELSLIDYYAAHREDGDA